MLLLKINKKLMSLRIDRHRKSWLLLQYDQVGGLAFFVQIPTEMISLYEEGIYFTVSPSNFFACIFETASVKLLVCRRLWSITCTIIASYYTFPRAFAQKEEPQALLSSLCIDGLNAGITYGSASIKVNMTSC